MRDAKALGQGVSCKVPFLPVYLPAEIGKSVSLTCKYSAPAVYVFVAHS